MSDRTGTLESVGAPAAKRRRAHAVPGLGLGLAQGAHPLGGGHRDLGDRRGQRLERLGAVPAAVGVPQLRDRERFPGRLRRRRDADPGRDRGQRAAGAGGPRHRLLRGGRHRHSDLGVRIRSPT